MIVDRIEKNITYTFDILSKVENQNGKKVLTGFFSPMEAAKILSKKVDEPLLGVIRINFKHPEHSDWVWNEWDSTSPDQTHNDFLIVIFPHWYIFAIDQGINLRNIAARYADNTYTIKAYDDVKFIYRQSEDDIKKMLDSALATVKQIEDQYVSVGV